MSKQLLSQLYTLRFFLVVRLIKCELLVYICDPHTQNQSEVAVVNDPQNYVVCALN